MRGDNPIRPPVKGDGSALEVQEIFETLQGEGPRAGQPAIFIRLGGCNLACSFCDTEFESFKSEKIDHILERVVQLAGTRTGKAARNLVVITGGEPLRQPIEKLCKLLLDRDFIVQVETNGTLYRKLDDRVEVICSPKNQGKGYGRIREDLLGRIKAMKFIVSESDPLYDHVPEIGQKEYKIPVYVQPMDEFDVEKNHRNFTLAENIAKQNGYNVSIQLHKILGLQ